MSKKKNKSKEAKSNGGWSHSRKLSPTDQKPITGNSEQKTGAGKQSTSGQEKKPKDFTPPSWLSTDPAVLAAQQADLLNLMVEAGWFIQVEAETISEVPVIKIVLAAPKGHTIGVLDGAITIDGEPV